jgi:hypothetical protein
MRKVLVGIAAVAAALGLRQILRRAGHKVCEHCGQAPCRCGARAAEASDA